MTAPTWRTGPGVIGVHLWRTGRQPGDVTSWCRQWVAPEKHLTETPIGRGTGVQGCRGCLHAWARAHPAPGRRAYADLDHIREWARGAGMRPAENGPLSRAVHAAYRATHEPGEEHL